MESPVILDKPPENYANERGFPFDEEEGSDAWSDLLVRHPELATRLRPSTWGRKRRPSSQDGIDDSADNFRNFDRFPFNNIPAEFRDHFPADWVEFSPREEQREPREPRQQQPPSPQHQTAATQTEAEAGPSQDHLQAHLPQYGLRNTVDLGQKSATDPSIVEGEDRSQRSVSAPPDNRQVNPNSANMSGQGNPEQPAHQPHEPQSNVRHIPIFVEGRDEPVINKDVDHGTHFADPKPTYVPPPQPHIDREQYYADDGPAGFPFTKGFDRPFFRQGAQPFSKQKMYPQAAAFTRGASPQRSQSPKPSFQEQQHVPKQETPSKPQQRQAPPPQRQTPPQQFKQAPPQRHTTPPPQAHQPSPPPQAAPQPPPQQQAPSANDPISRILSIQTDVLNLMTEVENFTGTKKDKQYIFLDEMLTRNLIKLDNIETDGKENIRQARKEAIKCIQKCIAVLEAKADNKGVSTPQPTQDVDMQAAELAEKQESVQNGDVEMNESAKGEQSTETQEPPKQEASQPEVQAQQPEAKIETESVEIKVENTEAPESADTRPEENKAQETDVSMKPQEDAQGTEKKSPKKTVKKRDKSKDKKKATKDKESKGEENAEGVNNKGDVNENTVNKNEADVSVSKVEDMQVDAKSDKNTQSMEVDGAASQ